MLYYVNLCHHVFLNIFDQHHFGPPLARSRWHNLVVEMDKSPLTSTSLGCTSTVGDPENWMNCWELLGTAGNCWEWEQCSAECHETMWKPCGNHVKPMASLMAGPGQHILKLVAIFGPKNIRTKAPKTALDTTPLRFLRSPLCTMTRSPSWPKLVPAACAQIASNWHSDI